ncbi:ATP-dependent protease LA [Buchnera aphidicola str. JF98 (Acyrthosiphon pisum)]|nr:ATP-dependent protease LA [Buchnera aphidicola str. JF98 (Acyrthosiphon pisum)]
MIPYENKRNLEEIPKNIIEGLNIHPIKKIEEVLKLSLEKIPYV